MSLTVINALRWWARETPDSIAISIDGNELVYAELLVWARTCAARLNALGVKPGDRIVGIAMQSRPYFAATLGAQLIGAALVPLNVKFTKRELCGAIEQVSPSLVLTSEECLDVVKSAVDATGDIPIVMLPEVEKWRATNEDPPAFEPDKTMPIAIMSTSGSTAEPKFVVFTHEMIVSIALELQLITPDIRRGSHVLICPPVFSGGLYTTLEYLVLGCKISVLSKFDAQKALDLITGSGVNVFFGPTIFWERIAALPDFADADLTSLKWAVVGGARVSSELVGTYRAKGVLLRCLYGQTEAGGSWYATGSALDDPLEIGFGGPFTDFGIMEDGRLLDSGQIGEIVIRSSSTTPMYWNNPDATKTLYRNGWLQTGDLGVLRESGSLVFVDRMKDVIKSGGLTVSAMEVENVIEELNGVEEVAVIATPDSNFGEVPMAIVYALEKLKPKTFSTIVLKNLRSI